MMCTQDNVISVEDLEKVMTEGLGNCYAFMGQFETSHLTAEGISRYTCISFAWINWREQIVKKIFCSNRDIFFIRSAIVVFLIWVTTYIYWYSTIQLHLKLKPLSTLRCFSTCLHLYFCLDAYSHQRHVQSLIQCCVHSNILHWASAQYLWTISCIMTINTISLLHYVFRIW